MASSSAKDLLSEEAIADQDDIEMPRASLEEKLNPLDNNYVDQIKDFLSKIYYSSLGKMKDAIGFKLNAQYNGTVFNSIFDVQKLIMDNEIEQILSSTELTANFHKVLSNKLTELNKQHQNMTTVATNESDAPQSDVNIPDLTNAIENINNDSESISNQIEPNAHLNIDVDASATEEENEIPDINIASKNKKKEDKDLKMDNKDACDENEIDEDDKEKEEILKVPNILKSLENSDNDSSNENDMEDDGNVSDANSETDNVAENCENNSPKNAEKDDDDENDLFSLDISEIKPEPQDMEVQTSENVDENLKNPFCSDIGQNDIDDICETAINGDINQKIDSEDDSTDIEMDKNDSDHNEDEGNVNSNNDSSDSEDNDDDKNNHDKKLAKIDKFIKDMNKLISSDSDSDDENPPKEKKDKESKEDDGEEIKPSENKLTSDNSTNESDEDINISRSKSKRVKKRLLSDEEEGGKGSKKTSDDDNTDDSDEDTASSKKTLKRKRKRVKIDKSSDEDEADKENDLSDDESEKNKSRKKIRNIISSGRLNKETISAEKAERERRKRIEEKQMFYNQIVEGMGVQSSQVDEVILDFDKNTKEILVQVDKAIVQHLKPHQVDGIKFMYDCTIESIQRLDKDTNCGCILAHSMGLGKTFQVIAFLHTIMTNEHIRSTIKRVLVMVPYNVIKNWKLEFDKWFQECHIKNDTTIYEICSVKTNERIRLLKMWHDNGGIMLITTTLFSNLLKANLKGKQTVKARKLHAQYLLDPGPNMVIIDEGHLLKNDKGVLNKTVSQIKTLRRVILTGTPLQNNLSEYYTMVNFVKPKLLGTKNEFKNRFENPIKNGQHIDSTLHDVNVMKKRVHILHKLLKDCIHRCDYSVLVPYLQKKFEYVLNIKLTKTQCKMYKNYIDKFVDHSTGKYPTLFQDFTQLGYIWNHPALLHESRLKKMDDEEDSNDSMNDFIDDDDDSDSSDTSNKVTKNPASISDDDSDVEFVYEKKVKTENGEEVKPIQQQQPEMNVVKAPSSNWYEEHLSDEDLYKLELSSKFVVLFKILEMCEIIGDKILVFSQSLTNLDLIERFLTEKMAEFNESYGRDKSYEELVQLTGGVSHRWIPNIDYFRIDGNVNSQNRTTIVDKFNDPDNHRARLMLVSIKAGGIGINLVGANRCVIFDVSWNPSVDLQAIFRIFRYGQNKPVYVYRFAAFGTMESKIYERQILKQSLSHRVVDEQAIQRHYKSSQVKEFYEFNGDTDEEPKIPILPKDKVLADIIFEFKNMIMSYHEHDSLLENKPEEGLSEEERKAAWNEYENEKQLGTYSPQPYLNALNGINGGQAIDPRILNNEQLQRFLQARWLHQQQQLANFFNPSTSNSQHSLLASHNGQFQQGIRIPAQSQNGLTNSTADLQINSQMAAEVQLKKFIDQSYRTNLVKIDEAGLNIQADINLDVLVKFENRNLQYFENAFNLFITSESNITQQKRSHLMFKYLEELMKVGKTYSSHMKNLQRNIPTKNLIYSKLKKAMKALDSIHFEFIKRYKNHFQLSSTASHPIEVIDLDMDE